MKLAICVLISVVVGVTMAMPAPDNRYSQPRPYANPDPYYSDEPVVLCANYPYCNDAPANLYHLQHEIDALRERNRLIVAAGEKIAQQLPNRPFVGGYENL